MSDDETTGQVQAPTQVGLIVQLAQKQPAMALVALAMVGGTGGTLGSMYIAPLVNDALAAHEADPRAHNVDRIEDRLAAIEKQLAGQDDDIDDLQRGVARAVFILEQR